MSFEPKPTPYYFKPHRFLWLEYDGHVVEFEIKNAERRSDDITFVELSCCWCNDLKLDGCLVNDSDGLWLIPEENFDESGRVFGHGKRQCFTSFGEGWFSREFGVREENGKIIREQRLFRDFMSAKREEEQKRLEKERQKREAELQSRAAAEGLVKAYSVVPYDEWPKELVKTYIMTDASGYYKIGRSKSPRAREHTLMSQDPNIRMIAVCIVDFEKELHSKYRKKNIRGEWFSLSDNDLKEIISGYGFQEIK